MTTTSALASTLAQVPLILGSTGRHLHKACGNTLCQIVGNLRHCPDVVVTGRDEQLTGIELDRETAAIAAGLIAAGVGSGDIVEIHTEDRFAGLVLMLGVLRSGAAYCATSPAFPAARLAEIRERLHPATILTDVSTAPVADPAAYALPHRRSDDLAYVIFTSGSTGVPKAVGIADRGLDYIAGLDHLYSGTTMGQFAPLQFDACIFEIFGGLAQGMRIKLLAAEDLLDPDCVGLKLADVDTLFLTTAVFNLLADRTPEAFNGLGSLLFGGERVSPPHVAKVVGRCRLFHVYGPTETTVYATGLEVSGVDGDVPIGHPMPGVVAKVEPVDGIEGGELLIGGRGLMLGYLGQPDETARAITTIDGIDYYRTGDIVVETADGYVFAGRRDRQIKVSGHRVDPIEIEIAASEFEGGSTKVGQVHVLGDGHMLRLFCTGCTDLAGLRDHLRSRLPRYLVPVVTPVIELPLTPNGKVDSAALLDMAARTNWRRERTHQELVKALGNVILDGSRTFLEQGGDSILAMDLVWALDEQGIAVDMGRLLMSSVVEVLDHV